MTQGDISNVEFPYSIHLLTQLVVCHSRQYDHIGPVSPSFEVTPVGQFMRLNPLTFIVSKVEEDPQEFVNDIENIFMVIHVTDVMV